jgi:hypothetical protein
MYAVEMYPFPFSRRNGDDVPERECRAEIDRRVEDEGRDLAGGGVTARL